ncbi:hypothetical protein HO662_05630 [Streptococcus suis]|uniref:hypothetical protein n=1 Tax=Streptococcus suis TaxID=1307 RepID=UPI0005CDA23E|nr:hypothetical protein [Streptococcus suis]NQH31620.1 hypothetical protein [Streptococcus suis]NQP48758.1 hypothetical protein [Streptococcus suis]NQP56873.1 hypothetical protein [Streptococcus suis]CYV05377.1 ABC transporter permease [Streptococcus suis]
MFHKVKSDFYRVWKERSLIFPVSLVILLGVLFAYLMRETDGQGGITIILSSVAGFIPLFFSSACNLVWGEEFTNRTINHAIIKSSSRFSVYFYKLFETLSLCFAYTLLLFFTVIVCRIFLNGQVDVGEAFDLLIKQLPFHLCFSLLCLFIKIYQAYLIYTMIVLMFDNLVSYVTTSLLANDVFSHFFLFNQVKLITNQTEFFTPSSLIALIFSVVYLLSSYLLFSSREFK